MIENIFRPSWIKDSLGALLVVATGGLYALGVGQPVPCDCGAVADDDDEVEMIETPIDAVPQPTVLRPIRVQAPSDLPQGPHSEGEPDQLGTVARIPSGAASKMVRYGVSDSSKVLAVREVPKARSRNLLHPDP